MMDQANYGWGFQFLKPKKREIILSKTFEFLTLKELQTASLTCKEWYRLVFSPKFTRNMCIHFAEKKASFGDIRAYQNYRNAFFGSDDIDGDHQEAMVDFFRAAPLEWFSISSKKKAVKTLLDDHLPAMVELNELELMVDRDGVLPEDVLRINHPNLKSVTITDLSGYINFEINCHNLTNLGIKNLTESGNKKAVQLVIQLQLQLQSLDIYIHGNQQLEMLANAKLGKLKKLQLDINKISDGIGQFFDKMVNLEELQLYDWSRDVPIGEELGALKNLSKLQLTSVIDTAGFEKALRQMEKLKDLNIWQCQFIPPSQSWHIASENVRNLDIFWTRHSPLELPHCKGLKTLKLYVDDSTHLDDIFVQICNFYPQLEKLHIHATIWAQFHSSTSFSHIKKLKSLKELRLSRLFLHNVDWTACSSLKIEKLHLYGCEIPKNGALDLFKSVGNGLQQLYLIQCNTIHFVEWDVISKEFLEWLRAFLPWCEIACDYYESDDDKNGNDNDDGHDNVADVEEPENIGMNLLQINEFVR